MDVRERLLDAALRVFKEAGSRGATTRRIASEAGVNEITLFRHFGSKEALLIAALQRVAERSSVSALPEEPVNPERELTEWCREHFLGLYQVRGLIRTGLGEFEERPEVSSSLCETPVRIGNELHDYLLRLRARGLARAEFDARAASNMLMGALFSDAMGRDVMPERYPYSVEEAPVQYAKLLLHALGMRRAEAEE